MPRLNIAGLKRVRWYQHAIRFGFGGLVSVLVALIGDKWGPGVAGVFLGFPAILPASLTLVEGKDGHNAAIDDAKGARLGSLGLCAFAVAVATSARQLHITLALAVSVVVWLVVSVALWFWVHGRPSRDS